LIGQSIRVFYLPPYLLPPLAGGWGGKVSIDSSLNIQFYQVPEILVLIKNLIHHNERELKIFTCDYESRQEKFAIEPMVKRRK